MVRGKEYMALGAAVLWGVVSPGPAFAAELAPAIVLIVQGPADGADAATQDRARRILDQRLRALGAPVQSAAVPGGTKDHGKIHRTALKGAEIDPGAADMVVALAVQRRLRIGAYTRHLKLTLRADLYPSSGGARRSLRAAREQRIPATCRAACASRLETRMLGEAAQDLAPGILRQARVLVPVPARRIALDGFTPPEIKEMRAYLAAFPGFVRMDRERARGKAMVIRYSSRLDRERLTAALYKMLGHLDMAAVIRFKGRDATLVRRAQGDRRARGSTRQW
jgi:hypothetical protein